MKPSAQLNLFGPAGPAYNPLQPALYYASRPSAGGEPRLTVGESRELVMLSGALNLLRKRLGLSFRAVDAVAVKTCGRRWCDFTGVNDYKATLAAL